MMTDDSAHAQAKTPSFQPNPALKPLEGLVGDWEMEISNASFLPRPSDIVKGGPVSFEWVQDGAFLVIHMGDKSPGPPQALWLIGRDDSTPNYTVLYYDARSVSRVYEMSFSEVWKMWREAPGFWQRYESTVSKDGKTMTAHWEKSSDGSRWEHDFNITYTKLN
jgi:hypothetical protein